jgi:endonuclease/exonuclease/phosphatase family metal-dependent hydrolase
MIRVMTLNIGNGLAPPRRLIKALRSCGADIVGLQEVDERQASVIRHEMAGI